jgi:flagellar protein FliO/FliZ
MLAFVSAVNTMRAETDPSGIEQGFDTASFYGSFVQVIITLAVIIGIIVLLIRFLARKNKMWSSGRTMRVLGGVTLGQNKSMQVVDIGGTLYIVGVGEDITLLDKITDAQAIQDIIISLDGSGTGKPAMVPELTRFIEGWKRRKSGESGAAESWEPTADSADSASAFNDLLQTKLKSVANRKEALREWMDEEDWQRRPQDK